MDRASGVFAALATPLREDGAMDFEGVDRLVDLVLKAGVDGICVGGATGESVRFSVEERTALAAHVARRLGGRTPLLTAIGASSVARVLEIGRGALDAGSDLLLLPMPDFFIYEQDDLEAFCRYVPSELAAPCLLYNLPCFTNALDVEVTERLLRTEPYLVGIKDSSGDRAALERLAKLHNGKQLSLLVGNDEVIESGVEAGWDGVVSGVASFCPELVVNVFRSARKADHDACGHWVALLTEVIAQIQQLPVPWTIRAGLDVRGIPMGPFTLPLSPRRAEQLGRFRQWFRAWLDAHLGELSRNGSGR